MSWLISPSTPKCVLLNVMSLGCLSFNVQTYVCKEFDTRRLVRYSSAVGGSFSVLTINLSLPKI